MNDNITVTIESDDEDVPEPSFIKSVVRQSCEQMGSGQAEINVQIVNDQAIRSLNKQYRHKDKTTNVLSFPCDLPDWVDSQLIGDIVLCPSVIRIEADQFHKSLQSRWAHMLVHGTLHLLGMSHDEETEQNKMEKMELKIMTSLGFDDPYQVAL